MRISTQSFYAQSMSSLGSQQQQLFRWPPRARWA
jgi:flagellar hook-associated protein 3 FlgL